MFLKGQQRIDEFAIVLLAAVVLITILMVVWTTPTESPPSVQPTSIILSMSNGTTSSFQMTILGSITNVTLSAQGAFAPWVTFDQNDFDVLNSTVVTATVAVPNTTLPGIYEGSVVITSTGGQATVSVTVAISNTISLSSTPMPLGSFTISFLNGTQIISSASNAIVSQGYFSSKPVVLSGTVNPTNLQAINSANLEFDVSDTNNLGNLQVFINGDKIFDSNVGRGTIDIPVPVADLQQYNTLEIQAGGPGFYFWANTIYELQNVQLSYSYQGQFSKQLQFSLNSNELSNFDHFQLSWLVQSYSLPAQPLAIAINNQVVYDQRPPLAALNQNFNQDVFGLPLSLGSNNTIAFSFASPASLSVSNAVLTVWYRSTTQQ